MFMPTYEEGNAVFPQQVVLDLRFKEHGKEMVFVEYGSRWRVMCDPKI